MDVRPRYRRVEEVGLPIMLDVFSPILNREVQLQVNSLEPGDSSKISKKIIDSPVVVETSIEGETSGSIFYIFSQKLAAAITDLMVMGDGSAPFNEQESLDGIAEASNQISGALSTFWSEQLETSLHPGGADSSLTAWSDVDIPFSELIQIEYAIAISDWGDEIFFKLIPPHVLDLLGDMPDVINSMPSEADSVQAGQGGEGPTVTPAQFAPFDTMQGGQKPSIAEPKNLDLLMDISLPVTIELGRTSMLIKNVLEIGPGSVIELQKLSGEPVDLYVNDKKFALGEVVVIDENFGIRITELLSPEERMKALR